MPPPNIKRLVLTAAVVSITITGTLYGAGLKTDQEISEVRAHPFRPKLSIHLQLCQLSHLSNSICPLDSKKATGVNFR
jgi:hypothetical protein